MFKRRTRRSRQAQPTGPPQDGLAPEWPYLDIVFLDEDGARSETDTFFQAPVVPRAGETLTLDGDFQRCGTFVVERVEYLFSCERRDDGWLRELGTVVMLQAR